jgi:hypothetical protein
MPTLTRDLRKLLEHTVKDARRAAEAGAAKALNRLRVGEAEAPKLTSEQELRRRLREHGRQLGDQRDERRGTQTIVHLKAEYAYEHWHRMLFARFLAETDLLIEPETGVAISLPECQELARERGEDWLELASTFAERMLPQIFRKGDPLLDVALPPETRSGLEDLLKKLPRDVFLADDSLGWVYQFWQAEKKDEVNASEKKIGADELPAVTQLFTEDYMVLFLLHNTLGAWWAGKILAQHPTIATSAQTEDEVRAACSVGDVVWTHLRFTGGQGTPWEPAAGIFDSWPRSAKEIRLLDPCMGSGHFLVFALPILVAVRMAEEGLSRDGAIEAALRENLFGLEIDPRCTQIAAFNLALAAWKWGGYQTLPPLHLACSGLGINARLDTWLKLAGTNHRLRGGMDRLYQLFQQAPVVGSLINPRALVTDLLVAEFHDLKPLLEQALADETDESMHEFAVTARGLAEAAEILATKFTLVATNVPYLGRTRQANTLMEYCDRHYSDARADLATCFIQRLISLTEKGGTAAFVAKQEWLFLGKYSAVRRRTLDEALWIFAARLGPHAFETITGERVNVSLHAITSLTPDEEHRFFSLDVSDEKTPAAKATAILERAPDKLSQSAQLRNPDSRVTTESAPRSGPTLGSIVDSYQGIVTGDLERFRLCFWEVPALGSAWVPFRTTVSRTGTQDGSYSILRWEQGTGQLHRYAAETRHQLHDMHESGNRAWGHRGVALNRMSGLQATVYSGEHFDNNVAVLIPQDDSSLVALLAFCSSPNFPEEVRKLDRTLKVTNRTLVKVPFNLTHWQRVGAETYPNGLPPSGSSPAIHAARFNRYRRRWLDWLAIAGRARRGPTLPTARRASIPTIWYDTPIATVSSA